MQNQIDISKLTPEQRVLLLNQLQAQGQPKDRGFLGNFMQRKIVNPIQESLGMRESLADKLRRQQIMVAQQNMLTAANERGRNQQAIDYVSNLTVDDAKNLGLNEAQLRLAQANPLASYDDLLTRSLSREEYSTTPQYGFDETGARIAYQLGNRGGMRVVDVTPSPDTYTVDTGSSIQIINKLDNTLVTSIPKQATPDQKARLLIEKDNKNQEDRRKLRETAKNLRQEFNTLTKDMRDIGLAFGKIQASAAEPSAAGDIALLINYMKMLDPGSVVREGEFATAQNAGGVDARTRATFNSLVSGERLSDTQRQDFVASAGRVLAPYRDQFMATKIRYSELATRSGVQPGDVVINDPFAGLEAQELNRDWYLSRGLTPPAGMK